MYKNLCPESLGITGRQSELIELALTYGFQGLDLDFAHFDKQAELRGLDHAARFLKSAKLKIRAFELPVRWDEDEETLQEDLERLPSLLETASAIEAKTCYATVLPASDDKPYHENFEFHRDRIGRVAEVLDKYGVRLGLTFLAPAAHREGKAYQFISSPDALLTLMKTTVATNLAVLVDLWHWKVGGGAIEQLRELSPDQIVMVRTADIPEDAAMESITEESRLMPGSTGVVDTVAAMGVLIEMGYRGPITPYPHPSQIKGYTRDNIVQKTGVILDEFMKSAGLDKSSRIVAIPSPA